MTSSLSASLGAYEHVQQTAFETVVAVFDELHDRPESSRLKYDGERVRSAAERVLAAIRSQSALVAVPERTVNEIAIRRAMAEGHTASTRRRRATGLTPEEINSIRLDSTKRMYDVLDLCLALSDMKAVDDTLVFGLIETALGMQTMQDNELLFDYLESRTDLIAKDILTTTGKGQILLRTCNDLLNRVSRTASARLAGRIHILIANCFALSDRSGINFRGEFDTDNVTAIEPPPSQPISTTEKSEEPNDEVSTSATASATNSDLAEYELYKSFWTLQKFFSNPHLFFRQADTSKPADDPNRLSGFAEFRKCAEATYEEFLQQSVKVTRHVANASIPVSDVPQILATATAVTGTATSTTRTTTTATASSSVPKYLTSPRLLRLQFADPTFRRHILVQLLIFFKYMLSFAPAEKNSALNEWDDTKHNRHLKSIYDQYGLSDNNDIDASDGDSTTQSQKQSAQQQQQQQQQQSQAQGQKRSRVQDTKSAATITAAKSTTTSFTAKLNLKGPVSQLLWVRAMRRKAVDMLERTPPNADNFTKMVLYMMRHETTWTVWKNHNCPPIERPPAADVKQTFDTVLEEAAVKNTDDTSMDIDTDEHASTKRQKLIINPQSTALQSAGAAIKSTVTPQLTALWQSNKGGRGVYLDSLVVTDSNQMEKLPDLDELVEEVEMNRSEANSSDRDSRELYNSMRWRALRLAYKKPSKLNDTNIFLSI
ncbi:hypothetical protein GQ42DRAFT_161345 [Ramicandelaber brevisporus]|nr:hypothetical protein GQ42DRAFT_161345 [Ramicandelaber brevisporus]